MKLSDIRQGYYVLHHQSDWELLWVEKQGVTQWGYVRLLPVDKANRFERGLPIRGTLVGELAARMSPCWLQKGDTFSYAADVATVNMIEFQGGWTVLFTIYGRGSSVQVKEDIRKLYNIRLYAETTDNNR